MHVMHVMRERCALRAEPGVQVCVRTGILIVST